MMVHFYHTEIRIRNSTIYANEDKVGNYNHKTVPRIIVTLQGLNSIPLGQKLGMTLNCSKVDIY